MGYGDSERVIGLVNGALVVGILGSFGVLVVFMLLLKYLLWITFEVKSNLRKNDDSYVATGMIYGVTSTWIKSLCNSEMGIKYRVGPQGEGIPGIKC